jgi:hypothetical protein
VQLAVSGAPQLQPAGAAASQGSDAPAPAGGLAAGKRPNRALLLSNILIQLRSLFLSLICLLRNSNFIARMGDYLLVFFKFQQPWEKPLREKLTVLEIKEINISEVIEK